MPAELGARGAAQMYARLLQTVGKFDLVFLGLGEDGHTANPFPGHDRETVAESPATLLVFDAPKLPTQRVSKSVARQKRYSGAGDRARGGRRCAGGGHAACAAGSRNGTLPFATHGAHCSPEYHKSRAQCTQAHRASREKPE